MSASPYLGDAIAAIFNVSAPTLGIRHNARTGIPNASRYEETHCIVLCTSRALRVGYAQVVAPGVTADPVNSKFSVRKSLEIHVDQSVP